MPGKGGKKGGDNKQAEKKEAPPAADNKKGGKKGGNHQRHSAAFFFLFIFFFFCVVFSLVLMLRDEDLRPLALHAIAPVDKRPPARRFLVPRKATQLTSSSAIAAVGDVVHLGRKRPWTTHNEPINFDPFSDSDWFALLIQDPVTNADARSEPQQLGRFRQWLQTQFPRVIETFQALGLLHPPLQQASQPQTPAAEEENDEENEVGEEGNNKDYVAMHQRRRLAQQTAWQMLLQHLRLLAVAPGETIVTQDVTLTKDVFFVLSGTCELVFRPKFLKHLLTKTKERTSVSSISPSSPTKHDSFVSSPRRLSLSTLHSDKAAVHAATSTQYSLRQLSSGDYFGVESAVFAFPHHIVSAISHGAWYRNIIGVTTQACLHVVTLSFTVLERIRAVIHASLSPSVSPTLPPFPGCRFQDDDVNFLRETFVFQSCKPHRLAFLATQLRLLHVPQHEYLFTTGQRVAVYLVKRGQLRVFSPEKVHTAAASDSKDSEELPVTTETRHVELEILQVHDMIGLLEAAMLQPLFTTYCLAATTDVQVYVLPPSALLAVLQLEATAANHVVDHVTKHHAWYKARKFTALNRYNKQTAFNLSASTQRKSPLPCSRCGWSGHTSTSSLCVRASSPKAVIASHLSGGKNAADALAASTRSSRTQQRLGLVKKRRGGSMVMMNASTAAGTGSLLPGLASFLVARDPNRTDMDSDTDEMAQSELERALDRLDTALDGRPHTSPARPLSQSPQRRSSIFNLREEALRVVTRISTARATTAPEYQQSPRVRRGRVSPQI
ncbi:hypothetical protein Poli38472_001337 [Pythium oligandrum]|uniref:Cyclic nucleotide-binding domain-containing protein n=1 Tax=Pythium oligandrum TaxID=41045 RepID=A0A8K1FNA6_PYTOL|nr:hypothetical protein Poli38472_001337 [Pythium oligandrum]|eukprot:TMW69181.1 hypothetical protein Poli38472_001337 [Pythium oligandrum]